MSQTTPDQNESDLLQVTTQSMEEGDLEILNELYRLFYELGWKDGDDVVVELSGTATSGIEQPKGYNERWSSQKGVTRFNKDAFIVIKNLDKNPVVSSLSKSEQEKLRDDTLNYETGGK